jgi:hypothetical protein
MYNVVLGVRVYLCVHKNLGTLPGYLNTPSFVLLTFTCTPVTFNFCYFEKVSQY